MRLRATQGTRSITAKPPARAGRPNDLCVRPESACARISLGQDLFEQNVIKQGDVHDSIGEQQRASGQTTFLSPTQVLAQAKGEVTCGTGPADAFEQRTRL